MDETALALISKIKQKVAQETVDGAYAADYPPVTSDEIEATEDQLGFKLPELLKTLYLEVGNGGFGPYDGIVGLAGGWSTKQGEGDTLLELYQHCQEPLPFFPQWRWPSALLPICEDGYGLICLDCSQSETPIISFQVEPPIPIWLNWEVKFKLEAFSFQNWLEEWVNKKHPNRK